MDISLYGEMDTCFVAFRPLQVLSESRLLKEVSDTHSITNSTFHENALSVTLIKKKKNLALNAHICPVFGL